MELKQKMLAAVLAVSGASAFAQAATPAAAPAAPEPDYTLAYNIGAVTEYRYRGISQSRFDPALQGGIDFTHKSGFYLGTWLSTIQWIKDAGGESKFEWDIYGGYKFTAADIAWDVGYLRYQYNKAHLGVSPNTDEIYGSGTWGIYTLKYSHAFSNLFGFPGTHGSGYLDGSAVVDLGNGLSLTPHIGHQWVHHFSQASYTDLSLTLGKDFGNGVSVSAALVGTDAKKAIYVSPQGKNLGRTGLVAGVKYAF